MDYTTSRAVLEALEREGVENAVFGAGAMNLLGLARFTRYGSSEGQGRRGAPA